MNEYHERRAILGCTAAGHIVIAAAVVQIVVADHTAAAVHTTLMSMLAVENIVIVAQGRTVVRGRPTAAIRTCSAVVAQVVGKETVDKEVEVKPRV